MNYERRAQAKVTDSRTQKVRSSESYALPAIREVIRQLRILRSISEKRASNFPCQVVTNVLS